MALTKEEKKARLKAELAQLDDLKKQKTKMLREMDRADTIAARKQRTRQLIAAGGLIEIAGLLLTDKATLLGALVAANESINSNPELAATYNATGTRIFAERAAKKQQQGDDQDEA